MRGSTAGLPDPLKWESESYYACLTFLDVLFSSFIITPAVVAYWRSIWELMVIYVYPNDKVVSCVISTSIGMFGHTIFALLQKPMTRYFHPDKNRILYYVMSRIYTVIFAFVCINGWRGPWHLLDHYTRLDLTTLIPTTLVGIVALACMRALRNVSAAPFAISLDGNENYFQVITMFRVSVTEKTSLYILDCLFSVLVIGTLVVFVWRGGWTLCDVYIFPNDLTVSSWTSLVIGYALVIIIFLLQPIMKWICDRITGGYRLCVTDVYLTLSLVATINVWRGIWNLLNIYLLPDDLETSCWITHWVCLIILILMNCSNSLLVRGVYIDAEEPAGKCVVFPCHYLRIIFYNERLKKLKALELENVQKKKGEVQSTVTTVPLEKNHVIKMNSNEHRVEMNHT